MAEVHDHLYDVPDLAHIPASTFVRHLADRMIREHSVQDAPLVAVDTHGVVVSIEHAIPLCLMLSELIALQLPRLTDDHARGELHIGMRRSGPSIQLTVNVRALGTGAASGGSRGSADELSIKLVKILASQLRGTVEHGMDGYGPFRVVFPAA
jgi:two-component sensor histidine kinase